MGLMELLSGYGEPRKYRKETRLSITIEPQKIRELVKRLVEEYNGEVYISSITPVDFIKEGVIEVNYEFQVIPEKKFLVVKTRIPRDKSEIDSIVDILPGAKVLEQEAYDLMGVFFRGNPYLRKPFLLPEHMAKETPLRKDWKPGKR